MGLTKKEISKAIQRLNTDEYEATVRGFHFFTDRSYLYEEDEAGYCTFVSAITSKDSVAKAILEWFKKYVEAIDDAVRAIDDATRNAVRAVDDVTRDATRNAVRAVDDVTRDATRNAVRAVDDAAKNYGLNENKKL